MAGLTVKYGDTVLSESSGTVNKTLKTAGKYCEKNFTISMVEEGGVVSYKYFTVIVPDKISGKWEILVEADADIAKHLNDETFGVAWNCLSPVQAAASTRGGIYSNAPMALNASDGLTSQYGYYMRTGSNGVGANARLTNLPTVKTTTAGAIFVDTDGSIQFYASSTYPILVGTYQVAVWW